MYLPVGFISGPGGFYGGSPNRPGFGPGGGQPAPNFTEARWVGPLSLVPIVGGSGGSGGCGTTGCFNGEGGGGAIVIASSTAMLLSGSSIITANGGYNSGSGGAIRLVANSLNVSGFLTARRGNPNTGGFGVIRFEAPSDSLIFAGTSTPAAVLSPINPVIFPTASPSLIITSVGGYAVPSYAGSRFDTVDLLLPNQLQDPILSLIHI